MTIGLTASKPMCMESWFAMCSRQGFACACKVRSRLVFMHHLLMSSLQKRLLLAIAFFYAYTANGAEPEDISRRVADLLARMTMPEKIGQLVLMSGYGRTPGPEKEQGDLERAIRSGACGNVFNVLGVDEVGRLQRMVIEETRLGIPMLFGFDTVHGFRTIFPIPLGETASWNLELMEQTARVAATESSAAGLNWTFAPVVDISRDPRWGRIAEGAGEDPYLGAQVARARVRGFQGSDLKAPDTVLACAKHFAAYGAVQAGRDYHAVDMSERLLREVYLPPFLAAKEAGVVSVMTAFSELNGTPASANRFLLRDILRNEWGFKGFVVSDFASISEMVAHGSAGDNSEAGRQALKAGVDMDMVGGVYQEHLGRMLAQGRIEPGQIDASTARVLEAKFRLGLFEDPFGRCDEVREQRTQLTPENRELAYRAACESFVLLKNETEVLPLKAGSKIAVIGSLADSRRDLLGPWKGDGEWEPVETILAAIRRSNAGGEVRFAGGCDVRSTNEAGFAEALDAVRNSDLAVLVMGESADMSGEAKSRTDIGLPGAQTELLRQVRALGKPVILVLMNGRPLALEEESRLVDVMLEVWFPGTEGARAIADVLFGREYPSGKLPVTFPRNLGQVPLFYSAKNTGRPSYPENPTAEFRSTYLDSPNDPLFPFGFGLSYTTFSLSDFHLDRDQLLTDEDLVAEVLVTNSGKRPGAEVVQLYVRDLVGSVTRPLLELKSFRKVHLLPGQSERVRFSMNERDLAFLREDMTWGTEPGRFKIFVGPNSRDLLSADLEILPETGKRRE